MICNSYAKMVKYKYEQTFAFINAAGIYVKGDILWETVV